MIFLFPRVGYVNFLEGNKTMVQISDPTSNVTSQDIHAWFLFTHLIGNGVIPPSGVVQVLDQFCTRKRAKFEDV